MSTQSHLPLSFSGQKKKISSGETQKGKSDRQPQHKTQTQPKNTFQNIAIMHLFSLIVLYFFGSFPL